MALPPTLAKLSLPDLHDVRKAAGTFLKYGLSIIEDIEKLEKTLASAIATKEKGEVEKGIDDPECCRGEEEERKYSAWMSSVQLPTTYCQAGCKIQDTAKRGISWRQLQDMGDLIKEVLNTKGVTIKDKRDVVQVWDSINLYAICSYFVKPLTSAKKISFVELIASRKQVPSWFVSHFWGTPYVQSLRMLQLHSKERNLENDDYYWVCTFANNQHKLGDELNGALDDTPFMRVLRSKLCVGAVSLMDNAATPFRRVWCVLETFETLHSDKNLTWDIGAWMEAKTQFLRGKPNEAQATLSMGNESEIASRVAIENGGDFSFPWSIAEAALLTQVKTANSSMEEDKIAILKYIEGKGLSEGLDKRIHGCFVRPGLYVAAFRGQNDKVKALLQKFPGLLNKGTDNRDRTALYVAAQGGRQDMVNMLLGMRADPNRVSSDGETPVYVAAGNNKESAVRALVAGRADLNIAEKHKGNTPLHIAAALNQVSAVRALVEAKADLHKTRSDGQTALKWASSLKKTEAVNVIKAAQEEDVQDLA